MQTKPVINLAAYSRLDINDDGDGDDNNASGYDEDDSLSDKETQALVSLALWTDLEPSIRCMGSLLYLWTPNETQTLS